MIFFNKVNKINVDFFTCRDAVFEHAKPKKAAFYVPDWWKRLPKSLGKDEVFPMQTIKSCPGVSMLYQSGFIVPLWSDVNLHVSPNGAYRYQFADEHSVMELQASEQQEGSPYFKDYLNLKFISPWRAKTKHDVKWLLTAPVWNGVGIEEFQITSGVAQLHVHPMQLNIYTFVKIPNDKPKIHNLKFGTPFVHFVPMSDKGINLHYHLVSEHEMLRMSNNSPMSFFFSNRFNKAKQLCPHA